MVTDEKRGAFDKLVADLSTEDRVSMLDRINKSAAPAVQFVETETQPEKSISLHLLYRDESFLYKFFLWLRSIFQKQNPEKLYNADVIARIAHTVNRNYPGIVNHSSRVLDSIFYQHIKNLKDAADFFKPYFNMIEDSPGDFYVFLSSFVTPQLVETINAKADPFTTLDLSVEPTPDVKTSLFKKLDEILKGIDGKDKSALYYAVSSVNWLKQFARLPYIHFTSQFTNFAGNVYTCPYRNAQTDFEAFAAVFSNVYSVQNEVLEALLLFSQKKNMTKNAQEKDIERTIKEFLAKANQSFTVIQMFISGVPVLKVGKIINSDYDWTPKNIEGAEAWFPSFRSHWRKIIDFRWNDWIREQKKNTLIAYLKDDFALNEFPVMPNRPWNDMWLRVPFACELTGGFLSWFSEELYDNAINYLNQLMLEGIFILDENRVEYVEGLNLFSQAINQTREINERLSKSGEYGKMFEDFSSNKVRSFQVQNQIDNMMNTTESEIRDSVSKFLKGARMLESCLHGIFDDTKDGTHDGLQNINMIKGHGNREWRDRVQQVRGEIQRAVYYVSELEPLDAVGKD